MERGAEGEWAVEEGDVGHAVVSALLRTESSQAFTQRVQPTLFTSCLLQTNKQS